MMQIKCSVTITNETWLFSAVVAVNKMVVVSKKLGHSLSPGKRYN